MQSPNFSLSRLTMLMLALPIWVSAYASPTSIALQARDLDGDLSTVEAYYDTGLNITWLADANFAQTSGFDDDGLLNWNTATAWASALDIGGLTNWRLPQSKPLNGDHYETAYSPAGLTDRGYNIVSQQSEISHLFHVTLGNASHCDITGLDCPQPGSGLTNAGPFTNLSADKYWTGSSYFSINSYLITFNMAEGYQGDSANEVLLRAWAVHPGDVGVSLVPEPQAWVLALIGLAMALPRKSKTKTRD